MNHTFVIPAYNDSPHLEKCIISIKNQTIDSTLILTTSTPSVYIKNIALKYNALYYINNSEEKGIAIDWNFSFSKVKTKFATIAHQDDIYNPNYLEEIFNEIDKSYLTKIRFLFTNYTDLINNREQKYSLNYFVKRTLIFPFLIKHRICNPFIKKAILAFGSPICCPTVTYNLENLNGFRFDTKYSCVLDWWAWLELSKNNDAFIYLNKRLVSHRIHQESETTNQITSGNRKQEELSIFISIWGKFLGKYISKIYEYGYKDNSF